MVNNCERSIFVLLLAVFIAFAIPLSAQAQCDCIEGVISAELNPDDPALGIYKYTIEFCWETSHGLSHWDLWMDDMTNCTCQEMMDGVVFGDVIGMTISEDGCVTHFSFEWRCGIEPSIGVEGILVKFEPSGGCDPGHSGTGVFYFYSNYPPAPIATEEPLVGFLINKNGNGYCDGGLTGVFPGMPCDPVSEQDYSWGEVKTFYR